MATGSAASAGKEAAAMSFAFSAATPALRRSLFRAMSATWKPSAPNFCATALEIPGPNPTMTMVFDICPPQIRVKSTVLHRAHERPQVLAHVRCAQMVAVAVTRQDPFERDVKARQRALQFAP